MAREPRLPALFGGSGSRRRRALSALRGVAGRTAATLPTAQVLEALAVRASDAVDDLASRLLAEDEAAAQLAYLVELATAAHGQEAVLAVVLRRNLWLNGTFLKMIEPMLRGREEVVFDAETLAAGRLTLLQLLVELMAPDAEEPAPDDDAACWALLVAHEPALPLDRLEPYLAGTPEPPALAAFLVGSYTLFLQTFLLRTTVRALPQLAGERPNATASPRLGERRDDRESR